MNNPLPNLPLEIAIFAAEIAIVGAAFFLIEKLRPAEKQTPFFKPGFRQELGLAFFNISISSPLCALIIAGALIGLIQNIIPYQIFDTQLSSLPLSLQILAACFIKDFSTYWRHRLTHRIGFLWPFHAVHHAAENLTWITALRLHPVDVFVAVTFDVLFLHILGFSGPGIALSIFVMKAYNYFTHANLDLQFDKPFRYIFASPNFHRWHHATTKAAYNKNFCSMFSLLDWMFSTYYHPDNLPAAYGLEPQEQRQYPKTLTGWLAYPFKRLGDEL
ncbi:MAG: sterol desaturase family protein [Bdellovibrionales bacterium]